MKYRGFLLFLAVLVLPVSAAYLLWPVRGLNAAYYARVGGRPVEVARTVDHELYFPEDRIFITPLMLNWDSEKLGSNEHVPVMDVSWSGWLKAPKSGDYKFSLSKSRLKLYLDDQIVDLSPPDTMSDTIYLKKGFHRLTATYSGNEEFRLSWAPPGSESAVIWFWHFYRQKPLLPLPEFFAVAAFILLLALEMILLRKYRKPDIEEVFGFVSGNSHFIALAVLLILAFSLRYYRYTQIPFVTETYDEYCTTLNGIHLVNAGYPSSWSLLTAYQPSQTRHVTIFDKKLHIVKPYFDHPPGYSYLVGLYLKLFGVGMSERFEHYFEDKTRLISIALGVVNAFLLYFLSLRFMPRKAIALLSVLLYAILPAAVITGRLVKEEHLILTCLLGSLLLVMRYLDTRHFRWLLAAALAAGISTTLKVSGLAAVGCVAAVLLANREFKAALVTVGIGLAFFFTFFLFGASYDFRTFMAVFETQERHQLTTTVKSNRATLSTEGLADLISSGGYTLAKYFTLTNIWLWTAVGLLGYECSGKEKSETCNASLVVWPFLIYLAFMAVATNSRFPFGWYRIPMYPFMAIAGAWWMYKMVKEPNTMMTLIFCILPLWDGFHWGYFTPVPGTSLAFRIVLFIPIGLVLLIHLLPEKDREGPMKLLSALAIAGCFYLFIFSIIRQYYLLEVHL